MNEAVTAPVLLVSLICLATMTPDGGWQRIEAKFTMRSIEDDEPPCLRIYLGQLKGRIEIRNCSLMEISEGPFQKTVAKVTRLEEAPAAKPVASYEGLEVNVVAMAEEFAASMPKASKQYGGKILVVGGHVTSAKKAMRPGTYALELNWGAVRVIVGGNEFGKEQFEELEQNITDVRKGLKELEKENKAKKDYVKPSSSEQRELDLPRYPTVKCEGKLAYYRNKVVEISPTRKVSVTLGTP